MNAILYVNTLMAYVNKEQLPQRYSSGYNYEIEIDGMDDLRLWAKNGLEQFDLERPNWILRAGEFEPSKLCDYACTFVHTRPCTRVNSIAFARSYYAVEGACESTRD